MMSTTRCTTNFLCNDIIDYAQNSFDTTQKNLLLFRSKRSIAVLEHFTANDCLMNFIQPNCRIFTSIATTFTSDRIKSL